MTIKEAGDATASANQEFEQVLRGFHSWTGQPAGPGGLHRRDLRTERGRQDVVLCADPETFYYAIEINGVLCGYSEIVQSQPDTDTIHLDQKVHARLTALGSQFDSDLKLTYRIDSETGRFVYHDSEIRQGATHLTSQVTIDGRKARFVYGSEERTVELPADTILENTLFHAHLKRDFAEGGADRETCKSYLSDSSIVKRIQVASLDGVILKKANLSIADFQAISHLKVRASLQPSGVWVTLEGLSVPGQSFSGTFLIPSVGLGVLMTCTRDARPFEERLQAGLDECLRRSDVKGASVAVIFPDETIWRGVSGISHERVSVQPEMSFAIGSITKNMVAALALQLAEEGKLSLEDPIGRWLASYPHVDSNITIRQMLNHTSGIFMFWDNQKLWDDLIRYRTRTFTPEEVLGYLKEPYFPPGRGYRYSNTNYLLTAMIITRATGSTLSAELRRRFWEPLNLRSACLALEEPYPEKLAHVWGQNFEKDGTYRDVTFLPRTSHDSITYGSAGVFMTAEDLARWTHALFQRLALSGRPTIPFDSARKAEGCCRA